MNKVNQIDYYIVDAFTDHVFQGNQAGVCLLEQPLSRNEMQSIAAENQLSETAFVVPAKQDGEYDIRWFTPVDEIDLCGHATLASAYVLCSCVETERKQVLFHTMSGDIQVKKITESTEEPVYQMILPKWNAQSVALTTEQMDRMTQMLGVRPQNVVASRDLFLELKDVEEVSHLAPDYEEMLRIPIEGGWLGLVVTAQVHSDSEVREALLERGVRAGSGAVKKENVEDSENTENIQSTENSENIDIFKTDFVSRYFCPELDCKEDPVTGSSHSTLIPYWSERLHKQKMTAVQLSKRTGFLYCENQNTNQVLVNGKAALYLHGKIQI